MNARRNIHRCFICRSFIHMVNYLFVIPGISLESPTPKIPSTITVYSSIQGYSLLVPGSTWQCPTGVGFLLSFYPDFLQDKSQNGSLPDAEVLQWQCRHLRYCQIRRRSESVLFFKFPEPFFFSRYFRISFAVASAALSMRTSEGTCIL